MEDYTRRGKEGKTVFVGVDLHRSYSIQVVYGVGYFGFWLHDRVMAYGAGCIVTPPSLLPQEYGNRVKTDRETVGS